MGESEMESEAGAGPTPEDAIPRDFAGAERAPDQVVQIVACPTCFVRWRIHHDLAGFAVACRSCGGQIAVPPVAPPTPPLQRARSLPAPAGRRLANRRRQDHALARPTDPRRVARLGGDGRLPVSSRPQAGRGRVGLLDEADVSVRARWTSRTILESLLVLAALTVPHLLVGLRTGQERLVLTPLASVVGGLLVLVIAAFAPGYSFGGLRRFARRHVGEGVLVAMGFALLAIGWLELLFAVEPGLRDRELISRLVDNAGLPSVLFMVALCPAFFEEIGFRGLLQSRLTAIYGLRQGLLFTATMFALAHGLTLALPILFALGLYLCWLRLRSDSLWPVIVMHMVYNSLIIIHATLWVAD
ncbi:MAG: CPBP family intramembrane glutamic endopeptidase [Planctomycetota bacterium]